jgi:nicotinamide-nucleotide amidase
MPAGTHPGRPGIRLVSPAYGVGTTPRPSRPQEAAISTHADQTSSQPSREEIRQDDEALVKEIADRAGHLGLTVATAESLTCGGVATRLGAGPSASEWFKGGVVAYDETVKFDVLGVEPGPVVTEACAHQMAEGVRRLLGADVAVALTGVGGPDPAEGHPAGTVHLAIATPQGVRARALDLDGGPEEVLAASITVSLSEILDALPDDTAS